MDSGERTSGGRFSVPTEANFWVPEKEDWVGVREAEWDRLRGLVKQIGGMEWGWLRVVYSVLFGFGGACGLALLSFAAVDNEPVWMCPVHWVALVAAVVFGVVLVCVERGLGEVRRSVGRMVLDEMKVLEERSKGSGGVKVAS